MRRVHVDFHTPDFVPNVGEKLDAEKFAQTLADGKVDQAAFFAKCHYGNSYYPTKVGRVHPGLQKDMLGEFTGAAAKRGVRVFAYYSMQLDLWYGKQHPECVQHPQPFYEPSTGHWISVCVNNAYGEYARRQIAEIVRDYEVAGIWADIIGYYPVCVCENCRRDFEQATGKTLPFDNPKAGIPPEYWTWQRRMLDDYSTTLAKMIEEIRPGCVLLCNTSSGICEKTSGRYNQADGQWCEEAVGGSPATLTAISLYTNLFDSAAEPRPFEIVTQRFHMGWGDWTIRPLSALQFDVATIIANGGLPSIGDQLYGDGSFEEVAYNRIGQAYRWLAGRQDFCGDSTGAAEVAVYSEPDTPRGDPGDIWYKAAECKFGEGLYKALLDVNCPVAALSSLDTLKTGRYKVLLVNENLPDTTEALSALTEFVQAGGKLLAVGIGPKRFHELLGVTKASPLKSAVSYICFPQPPTEEMKLPVLARIQGMAVVLEDSTEVLASWAHPVCVKTDEVFYSHQHAPPGALSDDPAVWSVRRGAGEIIGIAAPLAKDYYHTSYPPIRDVIVTCLDRLLEGRRQVEVANLPVGTEVTVRRAADAMFVHLVVPCVSRPGVGAKGATFYTGEPVDIHDVKVSLRLDGPACASVSQLGEQLKLDAKSRKGYASVSLQPFRLHTVVRFELKE